jgi:hypothetical protein
MMRERERKVGLLASRTYGSGRLSMNAVGEWFWIPDRGGRIYLGWSLSGAEHRLQAAIRGGQGRSSSLPRADRHPGRRHRS